MRQAMEQVAAPRALGAVRVRWAAGDAVSRDGHRVTVWFSAAVAAGEGEADRALFAESFGQGPATTAEKVVARFQPVVTDAVRQAVGAMSAEEAVKASGALVEAIRPGLTAAAFGAGLEVLPPFEAGVASPSLETARQEMARRQAAERRASERVQQFARAADLLRHWETLRADVPGVRPGALLGKIDPGDRGATLQSLLMASAAEPVDLWIAAGPSLVKVSRSDPTGGVELIALPTAVGPLRSVRVDADRVWVGARSGVLSVDRNRTDEVVVYSVPGVAVEYGFSTVATTGDRVWGVHRETGLVSWPMGSGRAEVLSPAELGGVPRGLVAAGGTVLFSVGRHVFRMDSCGPVMEFEAASEVVELTEVDREWVVVGADGAVDVLGGPNLERIGGTSIGTAVAAAGVLPWLSSARVLLCPSSGPVECVGLEDGVVTRFGGGPVGLKAVAGSSARVAGLTGDRQRVVLWNAWDGQSPVGEVHAGGLARHRAADLAMG